MGAINYYTSDYITLGVKPYEVDDYKNDPDFMEFIKEEYEVNTEKEMREEAAATPTYYKLKAAGELW